ncbi:MAG: ankyrin repeat domain-containing protein [Candidatus Brocadiia bacterium]
MGCHCHFRTAGCPRRWVSPSQLIASGSGPLRRCFCCEGPGGGRGQRYAPDWRGRTAVHNAAAGGDSALMEFLLAHGAQVNGTDDAGMTPLHHAARASNTEAVWCLLKHGSAVGVQDQDGWTPLHWAARNGAPEVAGALLLSEAPLDVPDSYGWRPVHCAAAEGNADVLALLLEAGADPGGRIREVPEDTTRWAYEYEFVRDWLGRKVRRAGRRETPLHMAAADGNVEVAALLIGAGADIEAQHYHEGATPLILATQAEHRAMVRVLLDAGADPNTNPRDKGGLCVPALYYAVENRDLATAALLVAAGADPECSFGDLGTALMSAKKYYPNKEMIALLKGKGRWWPAKKVP